MRDIEQVTPANELPVAAWMSAGAAIAWIAYRRAVPWKHWSDHDILVMSADIQIAERLLSKAVAEGHVQARGRRKPIFGPLDSSIKHEGIDENEFTDGSLIASNGMLRWGTRGDSGCRHSWFEIQISVADIEKKWPPGPKEASPEGERAPEKPITIDGLPAWLTALQVVAWVMTRDPAIVDRAGPTRRTTGSYYAELRPIGGEPVLAEVPGLGISAMWLTAHCSHPDTADLGYPIRSAPQAIEKVMASLRAGKITAKAKRRDGELIDMDSSEWVDRKIGSVGRGDGVLEPGREHPGGGFWYDRVWSGLRLPRDRVLVLWEPLDKAEEAALPDRARPEGKATAPDRALLTPSHGVKLPVSRANPETSIQRQYVHATTKAEFTGRLVLWKKNGGTDRPPTIREIEIELEDRFPGQWRRWQARELAQLWPKASRKQGRRSSR